MMKSNIPNETADVAIFHFSHCKSMEFISIATRILIHFEQRNSFSIPIDATK